MYHERTNYIDVGYNFVLKVVAHADITLKKIATVENLADMLTKPVPVLKFKHCLDLVGVCGL